MSDVIQPVRDTTGDVIEAIDRMVQAQNTLIAEYLEAIGMTEPDTPYINRVDEMPINPKPFHPDILKNKMTFWDKRDLADVTGVTVHHTCSHSPIGTANFCTATKGYPSIQYQLWVSAGDGCPIYLCAPLEWLVWNDNTGRYQSNISVGMAGRWDGESPSDEQITSLARLLRWLMEPERGFRNGKGLTPDDIKGHQERWPHTECPGWNKANWRRKVFALL